MTAIADIRKIFEGVDLEKIRAQFPQLDAGIAHLEQKQNHIYQDKRIVAVALFHRSALVHWPKDKTGLCSNEALEFLGDAFLSYFVATELMARFGSSGEGVLSKLRAAMVSTTKLVEKADKVELSSFLLLGKGTAVRSASNQHSFLADAFEAAIAALVIDGGEEKARDWLRSLYTSDFSLGLSMLQGADAKSQFQEWVQRVVNVTPVYRLVETHTNGGEITYEMAGLIGDVEIARARARNKKEASRRVAELMLELVRSGALTAEKIRQYAVKIKAQH